MKKNLSITIKGKEGIFDIKKSVSIFFIHETTESLKGIMKTVKAEINKMSKSRDVTVDCRSMDDMTYHSSEMFRYIVRSGWSGERLEVRPYQKSTNDYSKIEEYTFVRKQDMLSYLMKEINQECLCVLGQLPDDISYYTQELRAKKEENTNA